MLESLRRVGIGYFHAPFYHPVFKKIQPLRRALGVRTLFNLLGPLLNPLPVTTQLVGVAKRELLVLYAQVVRRLNMRHVMICHSRDGMDEISTSATTQIASVRGKRVSYWTLRPQSLGFKRAKKSDYRGGTAWQNCRIARALLQGKKKGPLRDIVVLNAAAGLNACGRASSLKEGVQMAECSLDGGGAYRALTGLVAITRR
jgi:anthranilate phosphoribosyltransferase